MHLEGFFEGFLEKLAAEKPTMYWTSYRSAKSHAKKHAPKYGMTSNQYLQTASDLYKRRQGLKKVRDKKKNADVYWDSKRGFKLVVNPKGKIVTMYNVGADI